jgi:hypothetical protein
VTPKALYGIKKNYRNDTVYSRTFISEARNQGKSASWPGYNESTIYQEFYLEEHFGWKKRLVIPIYFRLTATFVMCRLDSRKEHTFPFSVFYMGAIEGQLPSVVAMINYQWNTPGPAIIIMVSSTLEMTSFPTS